MVRIWFLEIAIAHNIGMCVFLPLNCSGEVCKTELAN